MVYSIDQEKVDVVQKVITQGLFEQYVAGANIVTQSFEKKFYKKGGINL